MTSPAQAAANAANARLSTGPRTEEGKARSCRNAVKHGLTAKDLVVRQDEQEAFNDLRDSLLHELAPEGAVERFAFDQLLHAAWNLARFRRLESDLFVNGLDPLLDDSAANTLDRLHRYAGQAERSYYRALKELRVLQTNRALRNLRLDEEEAKQVPVLVSYNDLTKRSHADVQVEALEIANRMLDYQTGSWLAQARPSRCQNEPNAAPPGEGNAA